MSDRDAKPDNVVSLDLERFKRRPMAFVEAVSGVKLNPIEKAVLQRVWDRLETTVGRGTTTPARLAAATARLAKPGPSGRELSIDEMRRKLDEEE
jgi:hypothetical protein